MFSPQHLLALYNNGSTIRVKDLWKDIYDFFILWCSKSKTRREKNKASWLKILEKIYVYSTQHIAHTHMNVHLYVFIHYLQNYILNSLRSIYIYPIRWSKKHKPQQLPTSIPFCNSHYIMLPMITTFLFSSIEVIKCLRNECKSPLHELKAPNFYHSLSFYPRTMKKNSQIYLK